MYKIMMQMPGDRYPRFVRYEEEERKGWEAVKHLNRASRLAEYFLSEMTNHEIRTLEYKRRRRK